MKNAARKVKRQVYLKFEISAFRFSGLIFFWAFIGIFAASVAGQKIAFLNPEKNPNAFAFNEKLKDGAIKKFKIFDDSLTASVAGSFSDLNFYNLSTEEARNFGRAVGCDYFVVTKAETVRRESLSKPAYLEAYAAVYVVSSRTGNLIFWKLPSFEGATSAEAEKKLFDSVKSASDEIFSRIQSAKENELSASSLPDLAILPDANSPDAKNFRSPLPYRRFKPEYTISANLYGVTATVDATVDLDENGNVARVEITRWAGYGLDESVAETIRKMQWRAAERNGKPLAIRVLLRYNFKKLKTDDDQ